MRSVLIRIAPNCIAGPRPTTSGPIDEVHCHHDRESRQGPAMFLQSERFNKPIETQPLHPANNDAFDSSKASLPSMNTLAIFLWVSCMFSVRRLDDQQNQHYRWRKQMKRTIVQLGAGQTSLAQPASGELGAPELGHVPFGLSLCLSDRRR